MVSFVTNLAQHLCNQLEVTYSFFETLSEAPAVGKLLAAPSAAKGPLPLAAEEHNAVFLALMQIFTHLVQWSGFDNRGKEKELLDFFKTVAGRLGVQVTSMDMACTEASRYFVKYAARVPTAEALLALLHLLAAIANRAGTGLD